MAMTASTTGGLPWAVLDTCAVRNQIHQEGDKLDFDLFLKFSSRFQPAFARATLNADAFS